MKKIIGSFFLRIFGWKVISEGSIENLNRCVLVVAPHTSNWDYLLGISTYWKFNKKLKVIIKDTHTKAFYGFIVRKIGAIGINRKQKNNLVNIVSELFAKEDFSLVITPEGSRSFANKWKLGFYYMAKSAKVPLVLAGGDYKKKQIRIGYSISYEKLNKAPLEVVLNEIETYFKNIHPRFPEKYNPKIY